MCQIKILISIIFFLEIDFAIVLCSSLWQCSCNLSLINKANFRGFFQSIICVIVYFLALWRDRPLISHEIKNPLLALYWLVCCCMLNIAQSSLTTFTSFSAFRTAYLINNASNKWENPVYILLLSKSKRKFFALNFCVKWCWSKLLLTN